MPSLKKKAAAGKGINLDNVKLELKRVQGQLQGQRKSAAPLAKKVIDVKITVVKTLIGICDECKRFVPTG